MNPKQLLEHFDRISEAPDAIPRLRQFILDLAVRGKLVEQDPKDEPASELLKSIQAEVTRLKKSAKLKKQEELPPGSGDEEPWLLPQNWRWTRLGQIADWGSGSTPRRGNHEFFGGGLTWLKSGELNDNQQLTGSEETVTELAASKGSFRRNQIGDVLIAMYGATIGKVAILAEPAVTNQAVCGCTPFSGVFNRYLFNFLLSQRVQFHSASEGGAQPNISKEKIIRFAFPLPPLAEQHRIVAKVDQLMALCDRLEAAQAERESRRGRLVAASLHRLNNAADPDAFREHARFHLRHLPRLTSRPAQIQQLRQTILDLAVQGKLVRQDRNDEPVEVTVARLKHGAGERTIRRGVPQSVGRPHVVDDWPLPSSWRWLAAAELLRLGAILDIKDGNHGSNHPKTAEFSKDGLPFITAAQVGQQTLDLAGAYKISGAPLKRLRVGFAKRDDVIFTHKGSVGRVAIAPDDCVLSPQTTYYRVNQTAIFNRYLMWFMTSRVFARQVDDVKKQSTRDFVPISKQYEFFHAVPPLAEQRRIVVKIEQLMSICDELEGRLTTAQTESCSLLETILHEALAPVLSSVVQASENRHNES